MATVARWSYSIRVDSDSSARKSFWQAYVANDLLWIGDQEGRFKDRASAKAAAERAYRDLVLAAGDPSAVPAFPAPNRAGGGVGPSVRRMLAYVAWDVLSYPVVVVRQIGRRFGRQDAQPSAHAQPALRSRPATELYRDPEPERDLGPDEDFEPDWTAPPRRAAPPRPHVPAARTADPVGRAPGLLGTFVQSRRKVIGG